MTRKKSVRTIPATPETAEPSALSIATTNFPIVGIGASVGGLAAFEAFFSGMQNDKDPDMAFVLVQHLAPDHKSILTDLIRRHTRTQGVRAVQGRGGHGHGPEPRIHRV